ncbi:MAG: hypothetical protein ACRD4D_07735, partial [Candidatus Acidiferrales bacterium]
QPVANQFVNLVAPREAGMVPVRETETDSQGRFRFVVAANPNERFMVQVPYRGVLYSRPALPTAGDTVTADIEVFEIGARPEDVTVEGHTIFLEPHRDHVRVMEFYAVTNTSRPPRAFYPDGGGFRFALPGVVGDLQVSAGRSGSVSLRQQPQPAAQPDVFVIDFAVRPGESEIHVSYALPVQGNTFNLRLPLPFAAARRHLAVPKQGVKLEARELTELQQSQPPQARVYTIGTKSPGALALKLTLDLDALEAAEALAPTPSPPAAESGGQVQIVPHPVSQAQWYIVGLTLFVLLLGLFYLYSLAPVPSATDDGSHQSKSSPA